MSRFVAPLLIVLACSTAQAQAPVAYLVTKTSGATMVISSYEDTGQFYRVVELDGRTSQLFKGAVASIVPLTTQEAVTDATSKVGLVGTGAPSYYSARTTARTTARAAPRVSIPAPRYDPPPVYVPPAYTYTPSYSSEKTVSVRGYTRKDGTYVRPHMRRPPRR